MSPTAVDDRRRFTPVGPPWRIGFDRTDKSGIVLGPDPAHVRVARTWAYRVARTPENNAYRLVAALSELVANAQRHSRSGDPFGTVWVVVQRRPDDYVLEVTDNGPRPGTSIPVPRIADRPDPMAVSGRGLRLVDALAEYWDWAGNVGGPLTVRAVLSRRPVVPPPRPGRGHRFGPQP
ncbi:ATP-binding protein [Nocardiopsis aegyptia]|uniref:ATP-binding protein n=1 Tax=Nocardiopsis aegyptia TaxID=220378 RepID=UPI0036713CDD